MPLILLFLQKASSGLQLKKWTPAQVFSSEYCKIFKNAYFEKHLQTTASVNLEQLYFKRDLLYLLNEMP